MTTTTTLDPRVYWADYGDKIEAYDRPASNPAAVRLAYAIKHKAHPGFRGHWSITTTEPNRWPRARRTKREAREDVARIARRILRARAGGA